MRPSGTPSTGTTSPRTLAGRDIVVNDDGCAVDDLSFCGAVTVSVPADVDWADFVATAVHREWVGVEALAALPGSVGEVVTRGGAAYHQGVADTVSSVRTWDRESDQQRTFAAADCEFAAGSSRFARQPQLEIRDVSFLLRQGDLSLPITDESLADALGIEPGGRASLTAVRDVALARAATPARP